MTATFEQAIPVILEHEGGLADDPRDPGGLTNMGITLATFRAYRGPQASGDELRALTRAEACTIYRDLWWEKYAYGRLVDQVNATKLFDCAVNTGATRAHRLAQEAANLVGAALVIDGIFGDRTAAAINASDPKEWLRAMCHRQMAFYQDLVDEKPQLAVFRSNWLRRGAWPFHEAGLVA